MTSEKKINVAIVGVGNCASSLIQGIFYYRRMGEIPANSGIGFEKIGPYGVENIDFVAAFDVDKRKIGQKLSEAIYAKPNCAFKILDRVILSQMMENEGMTPDYDETGVLGGMNPIVQRAPLFDGVANHIKSKDNDKFFDVHSADSDAELFGQYLSDHSEVGASFVKILKDREVDVLLNYLPVGSEKATQFWADVCLQSGVSLVNCIPSFIASDPEWANKFVKQRIPMIGDDMRSQFGASIVSAVLQELLNNRGFKTEVHYQDNVGGNTDFLNMQDQNRLSSKKISKENVIKNQNKLSGIETEKDTVAAGPAKYFSHLGDNKRAHFLITAKGFGDAPVELTADLSVEDSPNSGGVVIDAIRFVMVARDMNIIGPIIGPSAWTQKTPPIDMRTSDAYEECKALANADPMSIGSRYKSVNLDGQTYYYHKMLEDFLNKD